MITFGYNRAAKAFDPTTLNSFDEVGSVGGRVHREASIVSGVPLRPIVAEAETPDTCIACRQTVVAFTGSYDNGKGFRLDGASMERCGCGERLTPRRTMQPQREVVTAHCLEKMVYRQESVVTVKCGNRKCQETFELLDSEYRVYCSPECRKVESKAKKAERGKELRRQRREQWKKERDEKKLIRGAQQSSPRVFAFAAAVA